jgi:hypothetical protein
MAMRLPPSTQARPRIRHPISVPSRQLLLILLAPQLPPTALATTQTDHITAPPATDGEEYTWDRE